MNWRWLNKITAANVVARHRRFYPLIQPGWADHSVSR
jgi:hypothetical protein